MPKRLPPKNHKRQKAHLHGVMAEYACAAYLMLKGYSLIRMRYRNFHGEIDIIATKGKTLVFTEVKMRDEKEAALYSVTPMKQRVLAKAASGFIGTHSKYSQHGLRFDVMVVTSWTNIEHIKDAWRP